MYCCKSRKKPTCLILNFPLFLITWWLHEAWSSCSIWNPLGGSWLFLIILEYFPFSSRKVNWWVSREFCDNLRTIDKIFYSKNRQPPVSLTNSRNLCWFLGLHSVLRVAKTQKVQTASKKCINLILMKMTKWWIFWDICVALHGRLVGWCGYMEDFWVNGYLMPLINTKSIESCQKRPKSLHFSQFFHCRLTQKICDIGKSQKCCTAV